MIPDSRKQLIALGLLLAFYALLAFMAYLLTPLDQLAAPGQTVPAATGSMPRWQLAAIGAAFVLVVYGLLGLAGVWFARKLELPMMYRPGAGWRVWLLGPMVIGLLLGVVLVIMDQAFARASATSGFPHPAFPLSVIASAAAGIGEEVLFRGFVMGLWAFLFNLALRRWRGRMAALWIGNVLAALAVSASHIPAAMLLLKVASPAAIPALAMTELFLLNGSLGLVAGERYMRNGLVAAMGVHFWADVIWHVIWPVLGLGAASGL
jgi:membrane protease YdiL (CAAX protease family)